MDLQSLGVAPLVPIVTALVQIAKLFIEDTKYLPIISLLLGVGITLLYKGVSGEAGICGVIVGLAASGFYDNLTLSVE